MSFSLLLPKKNLKIFFTNNYQRYVTNAIQAIDDEYTKEPIYPPISDLSFKQKLYRKRLLRYENLLKVNTVEEKLFAINMPRYYGYKSVMLDDARFTYNCLPFFQHITRTSFAESGLPENYQKNNEKADIFLNTVKSDIEDAILFEYTGYKQNITKFDVDTEISPEMRNRQKTTKLIYQINRVLLNSLVADNNHLSTIEVDLDPRHEAFWFVGGVQPPTITKKLREISFQKDFANDPVDRNIQYLGKPIVALRHRHPLEATHEFNNHSKEVNQTAPKFPYDARTIGYAHDYRHATTIPGYWPGSPEEFGLLSYHSTNHIAFRNPAYGKEDDQEAVHAQGILCSYGWLFGQACYQGFSTYNDLTYPLATQTILTNGQFWSFYVYQLNTAAINCDNFDTNPRINQCWGTKQMKLFEEIDSNGKLIGFNDDVLKHLIQFYINEPKPRNIDMKPFVNKSEQKIADIEDPKRREFLETRYKHLVSNRPRHRLVPEIYHWEKIYKIDNKTLPLAPKRRFFELGINPFKRTLDDHTPVYIPKVIRPGGPKSRVKWEQKYYP